MRPRARSAWVIALLAVVALGSAAPVSAQHDPPSAVDQYAELVPQAGGPKAPGAEPETKTPLPPASSDALAQAPPAVAAPLDEIATSSNYGAPTTPSEPRPKTRESGPVTPDSSLGATLESTFDAVGSSSDSRLLGLLAALLLTTGGAVALAVLRARADG